ncbi:MAG: NeuD/PglB/VioB family sugar acetyltransferase [Candidatus Devosia symbiotica]|nr:NeuD/PglB/VioB family sugar acetyltransferase [Candidatus Devosia symbiotica]
MHSSGAPKTIILGAGGHAKVIIDTMRHSGIAAPIACVAREGGHSPLLGVEVIEQARLGELRAQGVTHACIGVGDAALRERLANDAMAVGLELLSVVSMHAYVSDTVVIGAGVVIFAGAVVQADSHIDRLAIINSAASIDHDCHVGELSHIAPGGVLCGGVTIGKRCWIGARSVVIEQRTVADDVFVAAGAVMVRNVVRAGSRWAGVPAHTLDNAHSEDSLPHG